MISVCWNLKDKTLSFSGHADCSYVCSAISVLVATLYVGYGSSLPPEEGEYSYQVMDSADATGVEFVCKALRILQFKHPGEVDFTEIMEVA